MERVVEAIAKAVAFVFMCIFAVVGACYYLVVVGIPLFIIYWVLTSLF